MILGSIIFVAVVAIGAIAVFSGPMHPTRNEDDEIWDRIAEDQAKRK